LIDLLGERVGEERERGREREGGREEREREGRREGERERERNTQTSKTKKPSICAPCFLPGDAFCYLGTLQARRL
jgi:hypothetical protein